MTTVPTSRRRNLLASICTITLAILACNAPGRSVTPSATLTLSPPTAQLSPTPLQGGETTVTPSEPSPTQTPVPDVAGPGGCTLNATYVADITIADNAEFQPGASFTKVWRIRNSGTCTWEEGTQLVVISGHQMSDVASVNVPPIVPEASTDVSVDMKAPSTPGTYRSTWQMQDVHGVRFGSQIYAQIIVPSPATDTPTPTTTPTTTPTATPTEAPDEDPPDLVITDLRIDTDDPRQGVPLHIIVEIKNQGGSTAENFRWAWRVCISEGCDYIEAPGTLTLEPNEKAIAQMEYLFAGWANYTTEAWADSRNETNEANEDNNKRQLTIQVKPGMPDLIISSIAFDPDPPVQNQNATIEVTVKNQGSKPAGAFHVAWWASVSAPSHACYWPVSGLAENESIRLTCSHAYPSWYANITTRAIADVEDSVAELDETNNSREKQTAVDKP